MKTLIRNGLVVDPANRVQSRLNLLLDGGKVAAVTQTEPEADQVVDATGKAVVPGFVDIHMHEDYLGPAGPAGRWGWVHPPVHAAHGSDYRHCRTVRH